MVKFDLKNVQNQSCIKYYKNKYKTDPFMGRNDKVIKR